MSKIFINPGHAPNGIPDPGAVGVNGTKESDVCKSVGDYLADFLKNAGCEVVALQHDNLDTVCSEANKSNADAFVSIHCNGFTSLTAEGMEIYTTPGYTLADPLATCIMDQLKTEFPVLPVRGDWSDGDVDKESGLYVLRNTSMPAVLVELAFITTPKEEELLKNIIMQKKFAAGIARGVTDWLQKLN